MRGFCFLLLMVCTALCADAQLVYKGAVDKYAVEFLIEADDHNVTAVYAYDRFDKPIRISGRQTATGLLLVERNFEAADTTTMRFDGCRVGDDSLRGTWYNARSGRRFDIRLARSFDLQGEGGARYTDRAILQDAELDSAYFRLLVSGGGGEDPQVTGIRIHHKGDDRLIHELRFEAVFIGLSGINTGDYNFDSHPDFSVFSEGFAGPNTASLYFLYDPVKKRYFESEIWGVSLEFDPVRKRITEVNQCCAGSQIQHIEYKLVRNKMVETGRKCFKWNEKKKQLEERPARECD